MLNFFRSLQLALIAPRHLQARIDGFDRSAILKASKIARTPRASQEEDGEDDSQRPWWFSETCYGDPLPAPQIIGATAVIPVQGVITSGLPSIYRAFGYCDTAQIGGWIRAAAADPAIAKILLNIDSPGGMVTGTAECGMEVEAACNAKPVIAHSAGMMDSAAYWIGSQADAVYCTPSADIGCIGVYQVVYDYTAMLEEYGVKATMIKDGALKGAGHPHVTMSPDQLSHLQDQINTIGAQFRAAVSAKRSLVAPETMQGQSFIGTAAAAVNLVAGLRSLESLI